MAENNQDAWLRLGIVCPSCGNRGVDGGPWLHDAVAPFAVVEEITRSWPVTPKTTPTRARIVVVDAARDRVDWESGGNRRLQCKECLAEFQIPTDLVVEFE